MNRRTFLHQAGACGLLIVKPHVAFGYRANSAVRYGLLGCGRRGTSVATSFVKNTDIRLVALADLFPDQLTKAKQHFEELSPSTGHTPIDAKNIFSGPEAYKAIAACGEVDAIQISTPPFFHVEHLDAITAAGKHAYCEKPLGVDVPQTRQALEIGKRIDGKLSVSVGFQVRSASPFVEIVKRIHAGQIGKIASISAHYDSPAAVAFPDRPGMSADEKRLRNWLWDRTLSGDILLEQNIHVIDVCNWVMQTHPIQAVARSSRKVVQNSGNTSDNYEAIFTYPGGVELTFSSTQFNQNGYFDVAETFFGSEGVAQAPYSGALRILGAQPWAWQTTNNEPAGTFAADGNFHNNLADADTMKDRGFIDSILNHRFQNQIGTGVESALTCMMGRKSAETGRAVSWPEIESDREQYSLGMDLQKFS